VFIVNNKHGCVGEGRREGGRKKEEVQELERPAK
jgi:hypothetical protein